MPKGVKGFQKGQKFTENHRNKLKKKAILRSSLPAAKEKFKIRIKPFLGLTKNGKKIECLICKKLFYVKKSHLNKRKYCSVECKAIAISGENNWNWLGGKTPEIENRLGLRIWKKISEIIRERDNHKCCICGKSQKEEGRKLSVHHILPYREFLDNNLNNLITLCGRCHRLEEIKYYARKS